jgi:hypothetical protein
MIETEIVENKLIKIKEKSKSNSFTALILLFTWIAGFVIAKGFWSSLLALVFPIWAWYLFIEVLIHKFLI